MARISLVGDLGSGDSESSVKSVRKTDDWFLLS